MTALVNPALPNALRVSKRRAAPAVPTAKRVTAPSIATPERPLQDLPDQRLPAQMTLTVEHGARAIERLTEDWAALGHASKGATLFQSRTWCATIAGTLDADEAAGIRIYCVRREGQLVALLPLRMQKKAGRSVLTGLAEPFQEFTELLIDPATDAVEAFALIHAAIVQEPVDYIHLGQVRQDGALHAATNGAFHGAAGLVPKGEIDAAPYVDLTRHADFDTYLPSIKAKTRKNMRNMRNGLEREGAVTHLVVEDQADRAALLARTFDGRSAWLADRGLSSSSFEDSSFRRALDDLIAIDNPDFRTLAMSLRHDDVVLAEQWGFIFGGRYYAYMSSWNEDYAHSSPGRLHLGEVIATCFDQGVERAEFMLPAVAYKQTWATGEATVRDLMQPLTLRGRLYVSLWLDVLRPRAKATLYAMPVGLRRRVMAVANRLRGRD